MKRSNETVLRKLALVILILAAIVYLWPEELLGIHTRRFCAYGKIYVEFEHDSKIWGTTFLDNHGQPISCNENDEIKENVRQVI